jgi:hypothetical protein
MRDDLLFSGHRGMHDIGKLACQFCLFGLDAGDVGVEPLHEIGYFARLHHFGDTLALLFLGQSH